MTYEELLAYAGMALAAGFDPYRVYEVIYRRLRPEWTHRFNAWFLTVAA